MALVEQGLRDDTVILFTSDHGEMLSDHCWCHKSLPYQGSIRVPMMLSGPQKYIGQGGRVDDSLVELRDVMPTCLQLAGAQPPPHLDGRSMLQPIQRSYLHGEHVFHFEGRSNQFRDIIIQPHEVDCPAAYVHKQY